MVEVPDRSAQIRDQIPQNVADSGYSASAFRLMKLEILKLRAETSTYSLMIVLLLLTQNQT